MIVDFAKTYLHDDLISIRRTLVSKLDGLSDFDVRRPLTATGTNLLGLVKHSAVWEARYFGEVFDRPFSGHLPAWDSTERGEDMWATEHETRTDVLERYRQACEHADATITKLPIDASGHVRWWPRPDVKLFNVLVHMLSETQRHVGHADILREQLDGTVGDDATRIQDTEAFWQGRYVEIERAAAAWNL